MSNFEDERIAVREICLFCLTILFYEDENGTHVAYAK